MKFNRQQQLRVAASMLDCEGGGQPKAKQVVKANICISENTAAEAEAKGGGENMNGDINSGIVEAGLS